MSPKKKLLVITDTAIYKSTDGRNLGHHAVVRELASIEDDFEAITWLGTKSDYQPSMELISKEFLVLFFGQIGGSSLSRKVVSLLRVPKLFVIILLLASKNDIIHVRGPAWPSFIATLIAPFFRSKIWWFKFAGSWDPKQLPSSYKFQRYLLTKLTFATITINGSWKSQPNHCRSALNPCLSANHIQNGLNIDLGEKWNRPLNFIFIGRLDSYKGIDVLIDIYSSHPRFNKHRIDIIGDGPLMYSLKRKLAGFNAVFHGSIKNDEVHNLLMDSHFLFLPSKAEGFPKVIAEAACYGTIPIVSSVGSVSQELDIVIKSFLLDGNDMRESLREAVSFIFKRNSRHWIKASSELRNWSIKYSYKDYHSFVRSIYR